MAKIYHFTRETQDDFEVTSYIFDDPESNYQGVLGLDFLAKIKFCIDLDTNEISLHEK